MCSSDEEKSASSEKYCVVECVDLATSGFNSSATTCCPKKGSDRTYILYSTYSKKRFSTVRHYCRNLTFSCITHILKTRVRSVIINWTWILLKSPPFHDYSLFSSLHTTFHLWFLSAHSNFPPPLLFQGTFSKVTWKIHQISCVLFPLKLIKWNTLLEIEEKLKSQTSMQSISYPGKDV